MLLLFLVLSDSPEVNIHSRLACLTSNVNTLINVTMRQDLLYPPPMSFVQLIHRMATSLPYYQINAYVLSTYGVLRSRLGSGESVQDTQEAPTLTAGEGSHTGGGGY